MFIELEELNTHMYAENIETITRGDETILLAAIDTACQEAKGYLSRFDTVAIFSATGADRNQLLLTFVKDMATFHLLSLGNPGIDFKLRQDRYDRAVQWLKAVQKGDVKPDLPDATADPIPAALISYGSNPQRDNNF